MGFVPGLSTPRSSSPEPPHARCDEEAESRRWAFWGFRQVRQGGPAATPGDSSLRYHASRPRRRGVAGPRLGPDSHDASGGSGYGAPAAVVDFGPAAPLPPM